MKKKEFFLNNLLISSVLFILFTNVGCKYDKPEILPSACDTAIVTFSGVVKPIITAHCIACHSGPNAPLSIKLDNYTGVKTVASNGKLLGAITHSSGFSPMPQNAAKLSDCNILKIRKWITEGAPNN
ncbi:MAG TPA: hypothetical protein VMY77_19285 [Chitinophagaceae bacterium]|nr:hypothetical protein [Chitinophagaceae bacterium]